MHKYILENQRLKQELTKFRQIFGRIPYIDDGLLKGGYKVVKNLKERDAIPYCYRKYGMKVVVVGEEETGLFREYILDSETLLNVWKEVIIDVSTKAETDASNLTPTNVISWRDALDVYSKSQVDSALALKLDKPTTDGSWVVTKSGSTITYTDASTFGQNIANTNLTWSADRTQNLNAKKLSFTGGRVSVPALELEITAENSVPNKIWTDGVGYYFNNNLGIKKKVALGSVFTYTPTGNFALSTIKTAMENEGLIFNDSNISIILGANNYICNIDIGAANIGKAITIERLGSGSISFTSSRTLDSGVDSVTVLNGKEISQAKIKFGTTTDFLIIRLF